jgi:hypothetical protein
MRVCFKCKSPVTAENISFREECSQCMSDLHVCLNCLFYDEGKANKCREHQADYVKERDRSNYCEYFRFGDAKQERSARGDAEKLFQSLFKKQ